VVGSGRPNANGHQYADGDRRNEEGEHECGRPGESAGHLADTERKQGGRASGDADQHESHLSFIMNC